MDGDLVFSVRDVLDVMVVACGLGYWCWRLNTRVAVAESEIRYLKEELQEDREIIKHVPTQLATMQGDIKAIRERLDMGGAG